MTPAEPSYLGILGWLAVNLMGDGRRLVHVCASVHLLCGQKKASPLLSTPGG